MASALAPHHPYFPQGVAIPNYRPNESRVWVLLGSFGGIIAGVLAASLLIARRFRPGIGRREQLVLCWFVSCAFLHCFFEGYFLLNHAALPGSQTLFAQLWKEYALSDSRYMTSDPFMLCIEGITALIWGPLCVAIAACLVRGSWSRYPLQIVMGVGHLYGVALYYGTCYFESHYRGVSHSRPEWLYYWVYYVGFNFPWVVVPAALLLDAFKNIRPSAPSSESRTTSESRTASESRKER